MLWYVEDFGNAKNLKRCEREDQFDGQPEYIRARKVRCDCKTEVVVVRRGSVESINLER